MLRVSDARADQQYLNFWEYAAERFDELQEFDPHVEAGGWGAGRAVEEVGSGHPVHQRPVFMRDLWNRIDIEELWNQLTNV